MRPLARKTPGTRTHSIDKRVEQLERRVYPQIQYGSVALEFYGNLASGATDNLGLDDEVFGGDNNSDWRVVSDALHVPNFGPTNGGGVFHTFCSVSFSQLLNPYSAGAPVAGGLRVAMEIWDGDHALVDSDFPAHFRHHSLRYDNVAGEWIYSEQALFYNRIANADPDLGGWHAHFSPFFFNAGGSSGQLSGKTLTVVRYGQAFGQLSG